ncbi:hypothetical protein BDZ45DRAFT_806960 [Acephala macrosclerotiorum]|nr:hypothetical protein BDZ45DRAFT_806960 [Acephala macrosclerotiorum]
MISSVLGHACLVEVSLYSIPDVVVEVFSNGGLCTITPPDHLVVWQSLLGTATEAPFQSSLRGSPQCGFPTSQVVLMDWAVYFQDMFTMELWTQRQRCPKEQLSARSSIELRLHENYTGCLKAQTDVPTAVTAKLLGIRCYHCFSPVRPRLSPTLSMFQSVRETGIATTSSQVQTWNIGRDDVGHGLYGHSTHVLEQPNNGENSALIHEEIHPGHLKRTDHSWTMARDRRGKVG